MTFSSIYSSGVSSYMSVCVSFSLFFDLMSQVALSFSMNALFQFKVNPEVLN